MAPGFSLGATLIAETWPEKYRSIGIGIHDSGWGVGGIGAALIYGLVYPYTGWRGVRRRVGSPVGQHGQRRCGPDRGFGRVPWRVRRRFRQRFRQRRFCRRRVRWRRVCRRRVRWR